ncbi:transcription cofactor vestigial-like protein 2 [Saccoglossus kowalevskii]|uniref:Transcription cofactor vestigial-like protein 2-like n=1 Tax=Saccoglossus kowalevskii TaxID=10224 RepID=A0ABM0LU23_SACKO|nr:PREDICTED: transcription cofactor vestigial-like protein 2-like [Saccoglossus kowalevskii]
MSTVTMSCMDVMYQSPYQTYQPYPFYQHHHLPTQKFGHYKMHEPLESVEYTGSVLAQPLAAAPSISALTIPAVTTQQHTQRDKPKDEEESDSDKEATTPEAEYISSRCVLFTYFTGDIGKHVDEHFSRALSQPTSFTATDNTKHASSSQWKTGDFSPMSQRNFPPSFWNSTYSTSSYPHHDTLPFRDPYTAASTYSAASYSSLHQATDPWHYSLSTQSSYSATAAHRSMHDLSYTMASGSPFNTRYSSLLIQPSMRTSRLAGQCDLSKAGDAWSSRYGEALSSDSVSALNVDTSASATLEHQDQPSKDLYWF